jgi:hypothetical protein
MTWEEQDQVDHVDGRWAISPGHEPLGGDSWQVIHETDRYVIVEVRESR